MKHKFSIRGNWPPGLDSQKKKKVKEETKMKGHKT